MPATRAIRALAEGEYAETVRCYDRSVITPIASAAAMRSVTSSISP